MYDSIHMLYAENFSYKNIQLIRYATGDMLAFHTHNLEVAKISQYVWDVIVRKKTQSHLLIDGCRDIEVLEEMDAWNETENSNVKDVIVQQKISSLTININQMCNLRCVYCAAGGDGSYGSKTKQSDLNLTIQQMLMILAKVEEGHSFCLNFLGGEPLLHLSALSEVITAAQKAVTNRNIDLKYQVVTNGTCISTDVANFLAHHNFHVTVSIDGPSDINDLRRPFANNIKNTKNIKDLKNQKNTKCAQNAQNAQNEQKNTQGAQSSTEAVVKGLNELAKVKNKLRGLSASSVFGSDHVDVMSTYNFLKTLPFDEVYICYDIHDDNDSNSSIIKYLSSLREVAELAYQKEGEAGLKYLNIFNFTFLLLDQQERKHDYCGIGKSFLVLDTDNNFHICPWLSGKKKESVGNGLHLEEKKLRKLAPSLIEMNHCQWCWLRYLCGGGCLYRNKFKQGCFHTKDPIFCFHQKNIFALSLYFYQKLRYESVHYEDNERTVKQDDRFEIMQ